MTNVFTKTIFAVALLCVVSIPTAALANDLNKVASTVKQYRVVETNNGGGNLIVWLEKTANTSGTLAACASDDSVFIIDLESAIAEPVLSIVMTAHMSRSNVEVVGAQDCIGSTQRLARITMKK